jgi:hypothetical protein
MGNSFGASSMTGFPGAQNIPTLYGGQGSGQGSVQGSGGMMYPGGLVGGPMGGGSGNTPNTQYGYGGSLSSNPNANPMMMMMGATGNAGSSSMPPMQMMPNYNSSGGNSGNSGNYNINNNSTMSNVSNGVASSGSGITPISGAGATGNNIGRPPSSDHDPFSFLH